MFYPRPETQNPSPGFFPRDPEPKTRNPTIILAGTALLLLVTPLLFWTFTEDIFLLPKTVFVLAVGAPLAAVFFYSRIRWGRSRPQPVWTAAALLLFAVEGVAFSRVPALSAAAALPYLVVCGFFAAVAGTDWTEKETRFLFLLVCCAALATSVYSLAEFFGADPIFGKIPRLAETADERKVIRGFLGHADYVGAFLAITLPLTSAFFLAEKRPLAKAAALAATALSLSAILLTMTRASWLAVVAAAVFFIVCLSIRGGWKLFVKFSAAGAALLVLFFLLFSAFGVSEGETLLTRLFSIPDARHSANTGRIAFWGVALTAWERSPATGHGLGAFPYIFPKIQPEFLERRGEELGLSPAMNVAYAHNDYLQAAAENGAAGLLLLGAVGAGVFFKGLRRVAGGEKRGALLAAGCLAALVAALVDAVFMFPFRLAATGVYIAFAGGLAVSLGGDSGVRVSGLGSREKTDFLDVDDAENYERGNLSNGLKLRNGFP
ncbi:O-antigen ligase family protein, partial [Candidatus Uhrbacteria bacterium]|nr:O-antigen ligase family protein [Candidatus Uhrbacteria bacterium]